MSHHIVLPISVEELAKEYQDGSTTTRLAEKYDIGASTVSRILKRYGMTLRTPGENRCAYSEEFLIDEYIGKNKTASRIGKETGRSHKLVTYWLNRYGIEQRPWNKSVSIGQTGLIRVPPDHRKRIPKGYKVTGEWLIGRHHSEETRKKMSEKARGPLNHNWRNGAKQQRYCFKFNRALKERVRDAFGRRCFLCGASENGRKLDVHHADYNKGQGCGHEWNLIPLCNSCHGKTNGNRHYYFNLLSNYWAAKYIFCMGWF